MVNLLLLSHLWENLPLDTSGPVLDPVDDACVEQVKTRIDLIADEDLRLLDELEDLLLLICNDDTIFGGVLDLGYHNSALFAMGLVELNHLVEWVMANNV